VKSQAAILERAVLPKYSLRSQKNWLEDATRSFAAHGCFVIEDALDSAFVSDLAGALYDVQAKIRSEVGDERLARAREIGVLRFMQRYNPNFIKLLEVPSAIEVIDRLLAPTAIQHAQNGFIVPSLPADAPEPDAFQMSFHQDFPRVLNGYMMSLNVYYAISDFTKEAGSTRLIPGSHQVATRPTQSEIAERSVDVVCPAGSMVVFDSTLWHAGGFNRSGRDRLSVNHQFTRSYIKPQVDYPRSIGADAAAKLAPRTQQLLGFYTRSPASLDEYYQPPEGRLYRSGQG
jgi:ectoine hydroxylase-related dioxygenase (phytanoyl-CoA dioxygenase family)